MISYPRVFLSTAVWRCTAPPATSAGRTFVQRASGGDWYLLCPLLYIAKNSQYGALFQTQEAATNALGIFPRFLSCENNNNLVSAIFLSPQQDM
jgi:hypothetical protein